MHEIEKKQQLHKFKSLLLFALLALGACSSEHEKEIEQQQPEGRTAVSLSVATKGEAPSEKILTNKTYVYRKGPGDSDFLLTQILDLGEEKTQVFDFANDYLTADYEYRFLSYIRFDYKYRGDYHNFDVYYFENWSYLKDGELKDLSDNGEGSAWNDLRIRFSNFGYLYMKDGHHPSLSLNEYYSVVDKNGLSIKNNREIAPELTGMLGRFAIEIFKSSDGSIDNPIETSDGESVVYGMGGVWFYPQWKTTDIFRFKGGVLVPDEENFPFEWDGNLNSWKKKLLGAEPYEGMDGAQPEVFWKEEKENRTYPFWHSPVKPEGSARIYSAFIPPGEYGFYLQLRTGNYEIFMEENGYDNSVLYPILEFHYYDINEGFTKEGASIFPGKNTVIKVAIPGDRVWDATFRGGDFKFWDLGVGHYYKY